MVDSKMLLKIVGWMSVVWVGLFLIAKLVSIAISPASADSRVFNFGDKRVTTYNGTRFRSTRDAHDKLALDMVFKVEFGEEIPSAVSTYANEVTRLFVDNRVLSIADLRHVFKTMDESIGSTFSEDNDFNEYPGFLSGYAFARTAKELGCRVTPRPIPSTKFGRSFMEGYHNAEFVMQVNDLPLCSASGSTYDITGAAYAVQTSTWVDHYLFGGK